MHLCEASVAANTCAKAEVGLGLLAGVGVLPSARKQCDRNGTEIMVPFQMQAERYAVIDGGNIVALEEYAFARLSVKEPQINSSFPRKRDKSASRVERPQGGPNGERSESSRLLIYRVPAFAGTTVYE